MSEALSTTRRRLADLPRQRWPIITVVVPVRNEAPNLREVLHSILEQDYPRERLEILAVDGESEDDSARIIDEMATEHTLIRRLSNPDRIAPCAFNVGIRAARGDYVAIMGAHTRYAPNYLSASMDAILHQGADAACGLLRTEPGSHTLVARAIAHSLSHRFGVGGSESRTAAHEPSKWVGGGVPYALFDMRTFSDVGLYDPRLIRCQDNDLHARIVRSGRRFYRTNTTWCSYRARSTLRALARYAYDRGRYHIPLIRVNRAAFRLFYFVPFLFVGALAVGLVLGTLASSWPVIGLAALYLAADLAACAHILIKRPSARRCALILPIVFPLFHISFGVGTWAGLFQFGFASRFRKPSGP